MRSKVSGPLFIAALLFSAAVDACRPKLPQSETLDVASARTDCSVQNSTGAMPSYFGLKTAYANNPQSFASKSSFLALFPESYRSGYVLLHQTESLDEADYAHPRLVFFGDPQNPRFLMGTDATEGNKKKFEIIEFVESARRFCFHEIDLAKSNPFVDHPPGCVGCHNRDGRPNWESYNTWPKLYGSRDGMMEVGSGDERGFRTFLSTSRNAGIYKAIPGTSSLLSSESGGLVQVINTQGGQAARPHSKLTSGLIKLNNQRIARLLKELMERPNIKRERFAILGGLLGCPRIDQFVPQDLRAIHTRNYEGILADTRTVVKGSYDELDATVSETNFRQDSRVKKARFDSEIEAYTTAIANMRYLLENRTSDVTNVVEWSMSFIKAYHFSGEGIGLTDVGLLFQREVFGQTQDDLSDPRFWDHSRSTADISGTCNQLKTASLQQ